MRATQPSCAFGAIVAAEAEANVVLAGQVRDAPRLAPTIREGTCVQRRGVNVEC